MQCLPEGTLVLPDFTNWVPSDSVGTSADYPIGQYAVPIPGYVADTTAAPSLDPLASQVGGSHYKDYAIQPVEFITANKLPFLEGCVIKRVCRHRAKNGAEDIRKAIHELQLILKLQYGEEP